MTAETLDLNGSWQPWLRKSMTLPTATTKSKPTMPRKIKQDANFVLFARLPPKSSITVCTLRNLPQTFDGFKIKQLLEIQAGLPSACVVAETIKEQELDNEEIFTFDENIKNGSTIKIKPKPIWNGLLQATWEGNVHEVKRCLGSIKQSMADKRLLSPHRQLLKEELFGCGLYIASKLGHKDICNLLIDIGAPIGYSTIFGNTPMHVAASNGQLQILQLLVARGVNIRSINIENKTPLDVSIEHGHFECSRWIWLNQWSITISRDSFNSSQQRPKTAIGKSNTGGMLQQVEGDGKTETAKKFYQSRPKSSKVESTSFRGTKLGKDASHPTNNIRPRDSEVNYKKSNLHRNVLSTTKSNQNIGNILTANLQRQRSIPSKHSSENFNLNASKSFSKISPRISLEDPVKSIDIVKVSNKSVSNVSESIIYPENHLIKGIAEHRNPTNRLHNTPTTPRKVYNTVKPFPEDEIFPLTPSNDVCVINQETPKTPTNQQVKVIYNETMQAEKEANRKSVLNPNKLLPNKEAERNISPNINGAIVGNAKVQKHQQSNSNLLAPIQASSDEPINLKLGVDNPTTKSGLTGVQRSLEPIPKPSCSKLPTAPPNTRSKMLPRDHLAKPMKLTNSLHQSSEKKFKSDNGCINGNTELAETQSVRNVRPSSRPTSSQIIQSTPKVREIDQVVVKEEIAHKDQCDIVSKINCEKNDIITSDTGVGLKGPQIVINETAYLKDKNDKRPALQQRQRKQATAEIPKEVNQRKTVIDKDKSNQQPLFETFKDSKNDKKSPLREDIKCGKNFGSLKLESHEALGNKSIQNTEKVLVGQETQENEKSTEEEIRQRKNSDAFEAWLAAKRRTSRASVSNNADEAPKKRVSYGLTYEEWLKLKMESKGLFQPESSRENENLRKKSVVKRGRSFEEWTKEKEEQQAILKQRMQELEKANSLTQEDEKARKRRYEEKMQKWLERKKQIEQAEKIRRRSSLIEEIKTASEMYIKWRSKPRVKSFEEWLSEKNVENKIEKVIKAQKVKESGIEEVLEERRNEIAKQKFNIWLERKEKAELGRSAAELKQIKKRRKMLEQNLQHLEGIIEEENNSSNDILKE